jgi:hypothetical protein
MTDARRKETPMRAFLLALVLVVGVGATAWAVSPGGNDAISGCYAKKGGKLRVVKAGKTCKKTERPLTWNRTGPAGAPGAPGARGPVGPKGDKGNPGTPSVAYATQGFEILNADGVQLGELSLPAGKYLLLGSSVASNGADDAVEVACLTGSSEGDIYPDLSQTVPAGGTATFSAHLAIELPAAATISVFCVDPDDTNLVDLGMALTAVPVGNVVQQP